MPMISIFISAATEARLREISAEKGRAIEDLCEAAVEEEAQKYFRFRDDPGAEKDKGR